MITPFCLRAARYERACWWLEQGVELVPLQAYSKHIQSGYGSHQAHITTVDFARKWFLNTNANLGVLLGGAISLAVIDWDDVQDYELWYLNIGTMVETLIERTARGYHVFFQGVQLPSARSNQCEFKASGVCMVAPSVHPTGQLYHIVKDMPIAFLAKDKARLLFPFLSEPAAQRTRHDGNGALNRSVLKTKRCHVVDDAGVVARIKKVRTVEDEIRASDVQLYPAGPGELVGLCPFDHCGHQDSQPSLWVNTGRQRWGCYAPGCESNVGGEKAHDVVNYRALSRGLSNREAIRQLANELFLST